MNTSTLTLESLRAAMRDAELLPPPYELHATEHLPPGTYYIVARWLLDADNLFPTLPRTPLVICRKGEEDAVHSHIALSPKAIIEASPPRKPPPPLRPFGIIDIAYFA
jgi:hypothetical protein